MKIDQNTLIPLSVVGAVLYVIFIVGSYANRVAATEGNVADLQKFQLENSVEHKLIIAKLGRIEGLLENTQVRSGKR